MTNRVVWQFEGQDKSVASTIGQIDDAIQKMANQDKSAFLELQSSVESTGRSIAQFQSSTNSVNNLSTSFKNVDTSSMSFFDHVKAFAAGAVLGNFFTNLAGDITRTGEELLKQTFSIQQYGETYVHILGSSQAAKDRFKDIFSFATDVPQTIPQILALDQMLTTMSPNPEAIKAKLGVTFSDMRQIIVDASSALNKNVEDVGGAIRRLYDGASGYGINSLRRMGMISNDELQAQGVQFKAGTNTILSDSDVTLSAVLKIWQEKYGGMAEVQSNTLGGILNNMKDFALNAFRELAGPSLDVAQQKLKQLWEVLKSPETLNQLAIAGDRLGKIADLAFRAFDVVGRGAAAAIQFVQPLTDMIGKLLDTLSGGGNADKFYFNEDAAKAFNANLQDNGDQITDNSAQIANLNDELDVTKQKQQNINDAYAGATDALHDQLTALERMHTIQQQDNEMQKLNGQILRDKALAVDHYNKAGQDAALRLVDEQSKMTDLQATKKYDAQKNSIEDQITAIERAKAAALAANAAEEHSIEQTIKKLQEQDQQQQSNLFNLYSNTNKVTGPLKTENLHLATQPSLFDQIGAAIQRVTGPLDNYSTIWSTLSQTWTDLPAKIQAFTDKISGASDKTNSLAIIAGFLDYQFKSFFTYIQDEGAGILSGFGSGINLVGTLISTMVQGLMSGFRELVNMMQNPTDPSKWEQGTINNDDLRKQLSDAWSDFNNQMTNPEITGANRYKRDQEELDQAWQQRLNELTNPTSKSDNGLFSNSTGGDRALIAPPSTSTQYGNYQGQPYYDSPTPAGKSNNIKFSSGSNILTANIIQQCPTCLAKSVVGQITANPSELANAIAGQLVSTRRF